MAGGVNGLKGDWSSASSEVGGWWCSGWGAAGEASLVVVVVVVVVSLLVFTTGAGAAASTASTSAIGVVRTEGPGVKDRFAPLRVMDTGRDGALMGRVSLEAGNSSDVMRRGVLAWIGGVGAYGRPGFADNGEGDEDKSSCWVTATTGTTTGFDWGSGSTDTRCCWWW